MTTTSDRPAVTGTAPVLPTARGPLSAWLLERLRGDARSTFDLGRPDPYGGDLQLALYLGYELHYRGFAGVDEALEWDPALLAARFAMEELFLEALRAGVPSDADVDAAVAELVTEPVHGTGISHHLSRDGELWQFREFIAHKSLYHLKEADPQAWVIPRLHGQAKSGLVTVEHDEYGAGRGDRMHSNLFAAMMREIGLDPTYGAYVDDAPGCVLAEVNAMSLCGLRRALRGASVGQFAVIELTSSPGSARFARAARRLGCGPATERFYDEHVEADAVHEQILRLHVLDPLLSDEPWLSRDVVFGMRVSKFLGDMVSAAVQGAWAQGRSSLRRGREA